VLLEAEGIVFNTDGRIDLPRFRWRPKLGAKVAITPGRLP
jgi:hypothetical protein